MSGSPKATKTRVHMQGGASCEVGDSGLQGDLLPRGERRPKELPAAVHGVLRRPTKRSPTRGSLAGGGPTTVRSEGTTSPHQLPESAEES